MKEKIDGIGRIGRKLKQLLNDLKEKREYWKLKEETVDRLLWRTRLVVRQNL
jgi:lactate dehydrogenase-like 2-hydroxyacid dehydrogenase